LVIDIGGGGGGGSKTQLGGKKKKKKISKGKGGTQGKKKRCWVYGWVRNTCGIDQKKDKRKGGKKKKKT